CLDMKSPTKNYYTTVLSFYKGAWIRATRAALPGSAWRTDEHAASSDEEVVGAAEPSMAMTPDGGLMILGSSVYRKKGYMYRRWKELYGNDDAEDLVWFAPSQL